MPRDRDITPRAIVASATGGEVVLGSASRLDIRASKGKKTKVYREAWQSRAWHFYDVIPEFYYSATWVGNMASKARLIVMRNGKEVKTGPAAELLNGFFGGREGQTEALRQIGIHLSVAGECYLVGDDHGGDQDEWEVVSNSRITAANGDVRIDNKDRNSSLVMRLFRPHPVDPKLATSPARPVLPVLSELEGLGKRVSADIDSRLTSAGLLVVPTEVEFTPQQVPGAEPGVMTNTGVAGFQEMLIDAASIAIQDQDSASAKVPLVAGMPGDKIAQVRFITFWTEFDAETKSLREELIRRLALGMDMPPEVLTGVAESNHWNAWAIEEASIKVHIEPLLKLITRGITEKFLWEALKDNVPDYRDYTIGIDTTELRLRPNRSKESQELYDRGAISLEAMLRENGFDPDADKMGDQELTQWFLRKVASGSTTPELVAEALRQLAVPIQEAITAPQAEPTEAPGTPSLLEHPTRDIPRVQDVDPALVAAGEVLVFRALERAGNRLKSKMGRGNVPEGYAASELYQAVSVAPADVDDLLADAWGACAQFGMDSFVPRLDAYARSLLTSRGPHDRKLLARYLQDEDSEAS